ncbi:hypothetical protein ACIHCV_45545 [Streptomyces sp. NPDC051956]|uniref:hypothetical protein n=1 Tax=Streptomyces sp. NPDC051956 TaxID=3365677 RepID=UPI0037CE62F4
MEQKQVLEHVSTLLIGPLVGVAVGEAGDADDCAQVQFAAADRGGDQRVTQGGALQLLPGVVDQGLAPHGQGRGLFSAFFPARMQVG